MGMFRDVVAHLQKLMDKHQARRIILGGNEQSAYHVRNLMPEKMANAVVAVLPIPILAYPRDWGEQVQSAALEYERQEEVNLAERFVHHAAEHFWIPKVDRAKHGHRRSGEEHVMEVSHDEVGVVNEDIDRRGRHENARQAADDEHRHE